MLVLSRKTYERIVLRRGDELIVVGIAEIRPANVRIGIEADLSWEIVREELLAEESLAGGLGNVTGEPQEAVATGTESAGTEGPFGARREDGQP